MRFMPKNVASRLYVAGDGGGGAGIVKVSASLDSIPGGNVILDEKCG
jgi:hypothetical protein